MRGPLHVNESPLCLAGIREIISPSPTTALQHDHLSPKHVERSRDGLASTQRQP